VNWYLKAFKEYATFSGRARRKEYWYFVLFYIIGVMLMSFLDGILGSFSTEAGIGLFGGIFILVHILPSIAVSVRRLHDISRTGWWYLLIIIPLIGPLVLFVFSIMDSKEANRYGPNPKLAAAVV
jgi:uncharacterized membrane protein YhaH (DUF805 family)